MGVTNDAPWLVIGPETEPFTGDLVYLPTDEGEFMSWVRENDLQRSHSFVFCAEPFDIAHGFTFANDFDAVLFKMRWM